MSIDKGYGFSLFSNTFLLLLITCLIAGCSSDMTFNDVMGNRGLDNPQKTARSIFKTNNKNTYSSADIDSARQLDKSGYSLYKNKRDREAIPLYQQSLSRFPMAKTYYNIGNSLMNVNEYAKAEIAYLTALEYYPKNYLYNYNLACAYSLMGKAPSSLEYLERALDMGYNAYKYIYRDPDMENTRRSGRFDEIMKKYIGNKLTDDLVVNVGYCDVDSGVSMIRYHFNKDKTFEGVVEGVGPYREIYSGKETGEWLINEDGQLILRYDNGSSNAIYIKLSTRECTY